MSTTPIKPVRILLLEDRPDDAELLVLTLEADGMLVDWKRVDTEADLRLALKDDYDVVLADYNLPQYDAKRALCLLKREGVNIPFIVVTGSLSEEEVVAMMKAGASDYLLKDRLPRLPEAVRHAISQHQLQRDKAQAERRLLILDWAVNASVSSMGIVNLSRQITFANPALLSLWGFGHSEQVRNLPLINLFEDRIAFEQAWQQVMLNGYSSGELQARRTTGELFDVQYTASLIRDEELHPVCVMTTFLDVTERRRAEESRREAEILRLQLDKEKELRDLKARFMNMMVHDFRNPLTGLRLSLEMLQMMSEEGDAERRNARLKFSLAQVEHMTQMLEDVLMIGKVESATDNYHPKYLDLADFLDSLVESARPVMFEQHSLHWRRPSEPVFTEFDPTLMQRMITNLLSNAVKYSHPGTIVTLTLEADPRTVSIAVADQGIGIPDADQARLFDAFYRASNAAKVRGTGLGLAFVRLATELHGGGITFTSQEGVGTTFLITLPRLASDDTP